MKTKKFLLASLGGALLTLTFAAVSQEVKIGIILPQKNQIIEKNISAVIAKLNQKCSSPFTIIETWYYSNCQEAATQANDAVVNKQIKILFNEGCFYPIDEAIKGKSLSRPYPVSSNTNIFEIDKHLNEFCQISNPPEIDESSPTYIINTPSILIHAEIPANKQGNYLFQKENVVAKLTQGDIVVENTKDKGNRYKDDACKKTIQFQGEKRLVWYDWSQTRDWLCVTIKQSSNPSLQKKAGWIHRLLIDQTTD
jgi:hypothetical protein